MENHISISKIIGVFNMHLILPINRLSKFAIFLFINFYGLQVSANPTTTPRIFSTDVLNKEVIKIQEAIETETPTNLPVVQIDLQKFRSELDEKIIRLKDDAKRTSSIDKEANLYIQIEQIEFLKEVISRPSECSNILNIQDVDRSAIDAFCNALRDTGDSSDKEKKYNDIVAINKNAFIKEFIDISIERINNKAHSESKSALVSKLSELKRSLLIDEEYNVLLSNLQKENNREKRYDLIKGFFERYGMDMAASDADSDLDTIPGSISYAHELYEHGLKNRQNYWGEDEYFKFNYLKYSENLSKNLKSSFGGFVIGSADSNQTVKINALEYDIYFGDKLRVPLTLYTAEIIESDESDKESVNRTKLLDSEMGTINLSLSSITKFRVGEICKFSSAYGCYLPFQIGVRVLRLPENNVEGESSDKYKMGGYLKAGLNTVFPITPKNDPKGIAGRLALSANYVYYYQGSTDLENLFPEVLNDKGEPALSGNDYSALNVNAIFTITDKITLSAKYFKGIQSSKQLDSIATLEFGYSID